MVRENICDVNKEEFEMAKRPVFAAGDQNHAVYCQEVEFEWHAGLSDAQKRRCVASLHGAYLSGRPGKRVLEISSKSEEPLGVQLSAFNLTKYAPSVGRPVPVECLFQGSKVFSQGGPYTEMYAGRPIDAKRDPRLKTSGALMRYCCEGRDFPTWPMTAFYNWLWCSALLEHPDLAEQLLEYDAFTDIVFNPEKSRNTQAEAAAVFVSLARRGLLGEIADFDCFVKLL